MAVSDPFEIESVTFRIEFLQGSEYLLHSPPKLSKSYKKQMKSVLQRAQSASVSIAGEEVAKIGSGLVVLLGIEQADDREQVAWLAKKMVNMRIFSDEEGKMNQSLLDIGGELLLISQFTLHASTKRGNRPSFIQAARPDLAIPLYEAMIQELGQLLGHPVQTGQFGADMQVSLVNDGPVTIVVDSLRRE